MCLWLDLQRSRWELSGMSVTPDLGTPGSVSQPEHLLGSPPPESPSSGPGSGEAAPVLSGQHRAFQETPPVPETPHPPRVGAGVSPETPESPDAEGWGWVFSVGCIPRRVGWSLSSPEDRECLHGISRFRITCLSARSPVSHARPSPTAVRSGCRQSRL